MSTANRIGGVASPRRQEWQPFEHHQGWQGTAQEIAHSLPRCSFPFEGAAESDFLHTTSASLYTKVLQQSLLALNSQASQRRWKDLHEAIDERLSDHLRTFNTVIEKLVATRVQEVLSEILEESIAGDASMDALLKDIFERADQVPLPTWEEAVQDMDLEALFGGD